MQETEPTTHGIEYGINVISQIREGKKDESMNGMGPTGGTSGEK